MSADNSYYYLPGQLISLTDSRHAVIRFVGNTHFAPGDWVGVELEDATGKNDGQVQGQRYFTCRPNYGMFVRPVAIAGVVRPPPPPSIPAARFGSADDDENDGTRAAAAERHGRRSPGIPEPRSRKSSVISASSRPNRTNTVVSPVSSAPNTAADLPAPAPSEAPTAPRPTFAKRSSPSTAPTSDAQQPNPGGMPLPKPNSALPKFPLRSHRSSSSNSSTRITPSHDLPHSHPNEPAIETKPDFRSFSGSRGSRKVSGQSVQTLSPHGADSPPPPNQRMDAELEDLRTTIRVLKKKREEDKAKVNESEMLRLDKQKFEGIIQKLQPKIQSQKQDISALRRDLKDMQSYVEEAQRVQSEHDSMLEMAAIDREMAEEMAETIKTELEALKRKMEELELEVEILRDENQELYKDASPEDKASTGWVQMEKTNERLREALMRLREMTQQQEAELRNHVKELETDLEDYSALKADYEVVRESLHVSESNVEELKQQIEALGAEDFMIEELSEKNMQYQEDITQLKSMIQDLESLKEVSDELELNHTETEKQMQDEIDHIHGLCNEQKRRVAEQDKALADSNYTITKFRDLVSTLHNDLENMRATQQITDSEANLLTARSKAMTDLNLKLQASASKAQMSTIDVELSRLEAEESSQQLTIVQHYLPDYFETEKNPILTFLRFKRIRFKSSLIITAVKEWMTKEGSADFEHDNTFVALTIYDKLTLISLLCGRFLDFIDNCSGNEFLTLEGASYELEPVERNLNRYIETLRKNELDGKACSVELERSVSLLQHLSAALIPNSLRATANDTLTSATMSQTHLDNAITGLNRLKDVLEIKIKSNEGADEESAHILRRLEASLDQTRSRKAVSIRVTRSLEEMRTRCFTLAGGPMAMFERAEHTSKEVVDITRLVGSQISAMFADYERTEQPSLGEISTVFSEALVPSGGDAFVSALSAIDEKLLTLAGLFEEIGSLSSDLSQTVEFERHDPPWIRRSLDLKTVKMPSQESESEILRLQASVNEMTASVGMKDKTLEEQGIKIELLESRMRESAKRTSSFHDVQKELQDLKSEHQKVLDVVTKQSQDIQGLEQEREVLHDRRIEKSRPRRRSTISTAALSPDRDDADEGKKEQAMATLVRDNDHLRAEVSSLQSAVRYLREENRRANGLGDIYTIQRNNSLRAWIDTPLTDTSKSVEEKRIKHTEAIECEEMLSNLLKLVDNFSVADLRKSHCPANRPATSSPPMDANSTPGSRWRAVKLTTRYHGIRQKEKFEDWMQWKDEVISKGQERKKEERLRLLKLTKNHLFSGHQDAILRLKDASSWRSVQRRLTHASLGRASKEGKVSHGIEEHLADESAVASLGDVEIVQSR